MFKKIALAALALLVIGLAIAYYFFSKKTVLATTEKPDFEISAPILVTDFAKDETAANAKYNDKIIQITGKIVSTEATQDKDGKKILQIMLEGTEDGGASFEFQTESVKAVETLKVGDTATFKGKCTGALGDVELKFATRVDK